MTRTKHYEGEMDLDPLRIRHLKANPPYGIFRPGCRNFMTPDLVGMYSPRPGIYVELSHGEGLDRGSNLYGVTVRDQFGVRLRRDPSACYRTLSQAVDAILEMARERE